jgi:Outer membrane protein beta-barrel domain
MKKYFELGAVALLATGGTQAVGADRATDRDALRWHLDAGYGIAEGETSEFLDDALMLEGGLTWRANADSPFALRADLQYLDFDVNEDIVELGGFPGAPADIDDGDGSIVGLSLGGVYNFNLGQRAAGYLALGVGPYHRDIELTQTALFSGIACDPFLGLCFRSLEVGEVVVADNDTTRLGYSAALGLEYPFERGALFIEARYLRIETGEPTEYLPIQIGFRF